MTNIPLSQLFAITQKETENFSTTKWLGELDNVNLKRIIDSSELFFNTFSEDDASMENDEESFECLDYLTLCYLIGEKEVGNEITDEVKDNCLVGLSTFAKCERMRRDGVLIFTGEGKISEIDKNNTDIELTKTGKIISSSMRTMFEISEAVEKSS